MINEKVTLLNSTNHCFCNKKKKMKKLLPDALYEFQLAPTELWCSIANKLEPRSIH